MSEGLIGGEIFFPFWFVCVPSVGHFRKYMSTIITNITFSSGLIGLIN